MQLNEAVAPKRLAVDKARTAPTLEGQRALPTAALAARPTGSALTLVVPIRDGRADALEALLSRLGADVRNNPELPVEKLELVHFFRWVVIRRPQGARRDSLAFESNYDGTLDEHLGELVRAAAPAIDRIYEHCEGYPTAGSAASGHADQVVRFLKTHAIPYAAFYRANPHKTAKRIRLESEVRDAIQGFLDSEGEAFRALPPREIYQKIRAHLDELGLLGPLRDANPRPAREPLPRLALRLLPALLPVLVLSPILLSILLFKEATDEQMPLSDAADILDEVPELAELEDRVVQNQLTHIVPLKPGWFRLFLLKKILGTIDLLARHHFNQGDLGGIPTIHFARWCLLDDGEQLIFFSNYDGSWENYLGDFIDIAAVGLTSVWSNTVGFPKTALLAFKGARDEERFKAWTRKRQIPTQFWYSAYPTLSVRNSLNNAAIAEGLSKDPSKESEIREWLALL